MSTYRRSKLKVDYLSLVGVWSCNPTNQHKKVSTYSPPSPLSHSCSFPSVFVFTLFGDVLQAAVRHLLHGTFGKYSGFMLKALSTPLGQHPKYYNSLLITC